MAKKKNQPTTVNNIQELNLEIDYDKLAEAMVKAQEKSQLQEENVNFTKGTFASLTSATLSLIGIIGLVFAIFSLVYGIYYAATNLPWNNDKEIVGNILACIFLTLIIAYISLLSIMFLKSSKEIEKSKDKNFVVSVFSALSGLIALVVAIIALFK